MTEAQTSLRPQLVRAADIASHRLAARQDDGLQAGLHRMLDWYTEVNRATDELQRGEWVLPDESDKLAASEGLALVSDARTGRPLVVPMSGGAEPADAANHHD